VLNAAEPLSEEDERLFETIKHMDFIVVVNKTDLPRQIDLEKVRSLANGRRIVTTSLLKEEGVQELEESIAELFFEGQIEADDLTYVSNARHISILEQALQSVEDAIESAEAGIPVDIIQIDVTRTWELLGEIIGDTVQES